MAKTLIPMEGLQSVNDYLDTKHHIGVDIDENINDFGRVVIAAGYDFTTREIICSLLAGKGLKLPNIQICLSINLKRLLNVEGIQDALRQALQKLDEAFDKFLEHTQIQNVLNRINDVLAEITSIANMINFCGKPITPIAIPNTLENAMQSFLGRGEALIDNIGSMIPDEIGGCIGTDDIFNRNLFNGGILGDISNDWDRVSTGQLTDDEINDLIGRISDAITEVETLIDEENDTGSVVDNGGSEFGQQGPINTRLGVIHDPQLSGIQGNTRIASALKSSFDQLAGYPVIDSNGNVYNNIFELFLDDSLIDLLRNPADPRSEISERQPVYNYCGEIVGYTNVILQESQDRSLGTEPTENTDPGALISQIGITIPSADRNEFIDEVVEQVIGEISTNNTTQTRTVSTNVTTTLERFETENLDIVGVKAYTLLAVSTDKAARVRIYANSQSRTADSDRLEITSPSANSGLIAEIVTSGAETVLMSPAIIGYNFEDIPTNIIPCAVTNKSDSAGTVEVKITLIPMET